MLKVTYTVTTSEGKTYTNVGFFKTESAYRLYASSGEGSGSGLRFALVSIEQA